MAFHSPHYNVRTLSRPAVPFHTLFSLSSLYYHCYYYSFAGCRFFAVAAWRGAAHGALDRRFRRVTVPRCRVVDGSRTMTVDGQQWWQSTRRIIRPTGEEWTLRTVNTAHCACARIMRIYCTLGCIGLPAVFGRVLQIHGFLRRSSVFDHRP